MHQARVPYQKIVFVCINKREPNEICCAQRGSEAIAEALKARIKTLGLSRDVRVSKSGCQDVCAKGPNVMVFPDDTWYYGVTLEDVDRIVNALGLELRSSALPSPTPPAAGYPVSVADGETTHTAAAPAPRTQSQISPRPAV